MNRSSARRPRPGGKEYHIGLSRGDVPSYVLLPGDPARVEVIVKGLDSAKVLNFHREYKSARGMYKGVEVGICSTGIGGPSSAIALEELAAIGCHTFIRVGSTGAIKEGIHCGDIIINTAAVRLEGTSKQYVMPEYPASASYEVTLALIESCEEFDVRYHLGVTASTDSFYLGQGRPGFKGYFPPEKKHYLSSLESSNVINFEMEAATLFTLGQIYSLRIGCVCTVFANRKTDKFLTCGEDMASNVACNAIKVLAQWDRKKEAKGRDYFFPSLLK
ncbi:MAG: nucleoside phosphorylase [Candidatus Methanofastidiosia archaeon]